MHHRLFALPVLALALAMLGVGTEAQVREADTHAAVASAAVVSPDAVAPLPPGLVAPLPPPPDPLAGMQITSSPDRIADLVVLLSIDGLRADAVTPTHRALARLRSEGAWATNAMTIRRSTTLPSHASMVTGVDMPVHGMEWNTYRPQMGPVRFPTIFRVARMAGLATTMIVGKNKLRHLVDEGGAETFTLAGRGCEGIVMRAAQALRSHGPGILFLHFADPDSAGHRRGWMSQMYLDAVTRADACTERVMRELSARPGGMSRVLLLVTADHGGHQRSHGSALEVDRRIPWYAWGGAAASDARIARAVATQDTAATVLQALGLPQTPGMEGRPVTEALRREGAASPAIATRRRNNR